MVRASERAATANTIPARTTSRQGYDHVLFRCHEEAAASVATSKTEDEKQENKTLADSCRHFVTRIAYECEQQKRSGDCANYSYSRGILLSRIESKIWRVLLSLHLKVWKGAWPMATAYLASLSACGGETVEFGCLHSTIEQCESRRGEDGNSCIWLL